MPDKRTRSQLAAQPLPLPADLSASPLKTARKKRGNGSVATTMKKKERVVAEMRKGANKPRGGDEEEAAVTAGSSKSSREGEKHLADEERLSQQTGRIGRKTLEEEEDIDMDADGDPNTPPGDQRTNGETDERTSHLDTTPSASKRTSDSRREHSVPASPSRERTAKRLRVDKPMFSFQDIIVPVLDRPRKGNGDISELPGYERSSNKGSPSKAGAYKRAVSVPAIGSPEKQRAVYDAEEEAESEGGRRGVPYIDLKQLPPSPSKRQGSLPALDFTPVRGSRARGKAPGSGRKKTEEDKGDVMDVDAAAFFTDGAPASAVRAGGNSKPRKRRSSIASPGPGIASGLGNRTVTFPEITIQSASPQTQAENLMATPRAPLSGSTSGIEPGKATPRDILLGRRHRKASATPKTPFASVTTVPMSPLTPLPPTPWVPRLPDEDEDELNEGGTGENEGRLAKLEWGNSVGSRETTILEPLPAGEASTSAKHDTSPTDPPIDPSRPSPAPSDHSARSLTQSTPAVAPKTPSQTSLSSASKQLPGVSGTKPTPETNVLALALEAAATPSSSGPTSRKPVPTSRRAAMRKKGERISTGTPSRKASPVPSMVSEPAAEPVPVLTPVLTTVARAESVIGPKPSTSQPGPERMGRTTSRPMSRAPSRAPSKPASRAPSRTPAAATKEPAKIPSRASSKPPPAKAHVRSLSKAPASRAASKAPSRIVSRAPSRAPSREPSRAPSRAASPEPLKPESQAEPMTEARLAAKSSFKSTTAEPKDSAPPAVAIPTTEPFQAAPYQPPPDGLTHTPTHTPVRARPEPWLPSLARSRSRSLSRSRSRSVMDMDANPPAPVRRMSVSRSPSPPPPPELMDVDVEPSSDPEADAVRTEQGKGGRDWDEMDVVSPEMSQLTAEKAGTNEAQPTSAPGTEEVAISYEPTEPLSEFSAAPNEAGRDHGEAAQEGLLHPTVSEEPTSSIADVPGTAVTDAVAAATSVPTPKPRRTRAKSLVQPTRVSPRTNKGTTATLAAPPSAAAGASKIVTTAANKGKTKEQPKEEQSKEEKLKPVQNGRLKQTSLRAFMKGSSANATSTPITPATLANMTPARPGSRDTKAAPANAGPSTTTMPAVKPSMLPVPSPRKPTISGATPLGTLSKPPWSISAITPASSRPPLRSSLSTLASALDKLAMPPPSRPNTSLGLNHDESEVSESEVSSAGTYSALGKTKGKAKDDFSLGGVKGGAGSAVRGRSASTNANMSVSRSTSVAPRSKSGLGMMQRSASLAPSAAASARSTGSAASSGTAASSASRLGAGAGPFGSRVPVRGTTGLRGRGTTGIFGRTGANARASQKSSLPMVIGSPVKGGDAGGDAVGGDGDMQMDGNESERRGRDSGKWAGLAGLGRPGDGGGRQAAGAMDVDSAAATALFTPSRSDKDDDGNLILVQSSPSTSAQEKGKVRDASALESLMPSVDSNADTADIKKHRPRGDSRRASMALQSLSQSLSIMPVTPPRHVAIGTRTGLRSSTGDHPSGVNGTGESDSASKDADTLAIPSNTAGGSATSVSGSENVSGNGKDKSKKTLKVLKSCTIFVDVRTDDGDNAGSLFVDMLRGLGARILSRVGQSCTHIVFKNGLPSTLSRYRLLNDPKPAVVGIAWVVECVEQRARVDEAKFKVDLDNVNVSGMNKRRRSMLPKSFSTPTRPAPAGGSSDVEDDGVPGSERTSSPPQDPDASLRSIEDDLPPLERARRRRAATLTNAGKG